MDKKEIIKCKNISFSYHETKDALNNISLSIYEGEKIALLGPNGAGKSTLMLQLNGILKGKGEIEINNTPLNKDNLNHIRKIVGIVFQDPNDQLFCPTVFDDVAFGPLHFGYSHDEVKKIVKDSLNAVELLGFEEKSSHHLSQGEKKRVSIATVLACRPEIILLDEPSANLDPKHRQDLINMINEWKYTTIIATHDFDLARQVCDRCIVLENGEISDSGPFHQYFQGKADQEGLML